MQREKKRSRKDKWCRKGWIVAKMGSGCRKAWAQGQGPRFAWQLGLFSGVLWSGQLM